MPLRSDPGPDPTSSTYRGPFRSRMWVRRPELDHRRAENRIAAFVYGDVLVLAASAGVSPGSVRSGEAIAIVVATVVSTYLAHVLADVAGAVFGGEAIVPALRAELRDALPIAAAGLPSCLLFGGAALGWLGPVLAQVLACALLVARLASLGLVYRRWREPIPLTRAVGMGVTLAVFAALAVAIKLVLVH